MGMIDDALVLPVGAQSLPESCFVDNVCCVYVDFV